MLYYYYANRNCYDNGSEYSGGWYNRGVSGTNQEFGLPGNQVWFDRLFVCKASDEGRAVGGGDRRYRTDDQIIQPNNHPTKKGLNLLSCPFPE